MVTFNILNATGSNIDDLGVNNASGLASEILNIAIEEDEEELIDYFSNDEKFYAYVQIPPAFLSLACSLFVLQHVLRTKFFRSSTKQQQRTRVRSGLTFPRFLVGLCALDCMSSMSLLLEPLVALAAPQPAVDHWTCDASGYTKVVGNCGASMYNGLIALYTYFVVVRNWTDDYLVQWFEPLGHVFVWFWTFFFIAGIPLEAYNPYWGIMDCWARAYPPGCTSDGTDGTQVCTRGEYWGSVMGWIANIGFLVVLGSLILSNILIYCNVRHLLRRTQRYSQPGSTRSLNNNNDGGGSSAFLGGVSTTSSAALSLQDSSPRAGDQRRTSSTTTRCRRSCSETIMNRDRTREVAVKSFLYAAGFLLTYIFSFVGGVLGAGAVPSHHGTWWYRILRTVQEVTFPLQGFFNFCVYVYPKYVEWRQVQLYRDGIPNRWRALKDAMSTQPFPDAGTLRRMKRNHLQSLQSGASSTNLIPGPRSSNVAPNVFDSSRHLNIVDIATDLTKDDTISPPEDVALDDPFAVSAVTDDDDGDGDGDSVNEGAAESVKDIDAPTLDSFGNSAPLMTGSQRTLGAHDNLIPVLNNNEAHDFDDDAHVVKS